MTLGLVGKVIRIKRRPAEGGNGPERSDERKRIVKRTVERSTNYR